MPARKKSASQATQQQEENDENTTFSPAPILRRGGKKGGNNSNSKRTTGSRGAIAPSQTPNRPTNANEEDMATQVRSQLTPTQEQPAVFGSTQKRSNKSQDKQQQQQQQQQQQNDEDDFGLVFNVPSAVENGSTAARPLFGAAPQPPSQTPATGIANRRRANRSPSHERFAAQSFVTPANNHHVLRGNNANRGALFHGGATSVRRGGGGVGAASDDWLLMGASNGFLESNNNNNNNNAAGNNNSIFDTASQLTDDEGAPLTITQEQPLHLREGVALPSPLPFFTQDFDDDQQTASRSRARGGAGVAGAGGGGLMLDPYLSQSQDPNVPQLSRPVKDVDQWKNNTLSFFSFIDQRPLKVTKG